MIVKYNYRFEPDSTSIDSLYFDSKNKQLAIKFNNGNWAGYVGIPTYVYDALVNASSVGGYYNANIRSYYRGFKVDGVESAEAVANPVEANATQKFKVVVEITGDLTLEVGATDLADALKVAQEQITRNLGDSVKVQFKGVNVV